LESASKPGQVNVSVNTFLHVKNLRDLTVRGSMDVKNMGQLPMYFIDHLKPDFSLDGDGWRPSNKLKSAMIGVTSAWSLPQ
jgi:hypothetical protein